MISIDSGDRLARFGQVLAHPLRVAIFDSLGRGYASPARLAKALDKPLNTVSYHVKRLRELGLVKPVESPEHGTTEQLYASTFAASGVSCMSAELDAKGWVEVLQILEDAKERISLTTKREAQRLEQAGGRGMPATVVLAIFGLGREVEAADDVDDQ